MAAWLRSLPKPVGLMAVTNNRGHQVLNVCGEHGVAVPDEVAVIGVDNDENALRVVRSALVERRLESLARGLRGRRPAGPDDEGQGARRAETLIPPLGVVTRKSTDVLTIADADLAAALRLIRQHACDGLTIDDVVNQVHVSRSTLKRRFAALLRRSPNDEIRRVQLEHVMRLLSTTKLPLAKIAPLAGFLHVESMCKRFKKKTGMTPGQYRRLWSEQGARGG